MGLEERAFFEGQEALHKEIERLKEALCRDPDAYDSIKELQISTAQIKELKGDRYQKTEVKIHFYLEVRYRFYPSSGWSGVWIKGIDEPTQKLLEEIKNGMAQGITPYFPSPALLYPGSYTQNPITLRTERELSLFGKKALQEALRKDKETIEELVDLANSHRDYTSRRKN